MIRQSLISFTPITKAKVEDQPVKKQVNIYTQKSFDTYDRDESLYIKEENSTQQKTYLEQFLTCIYTVLLDESHLFNEDELNIVQAFQLISEESQLLYIKLFNRKWKWIRTITLDPTFSSFNFSELKENNLILSNEIHKCEEWIRLLTKTELVSLAQLYHIKHHSLNKPRLLQKLLEVREHSSLIISRTEIEEKLCDRIKSIIGDVVMLTENTRNLFQKFFIIFERISIWPDKDQFMLNSILTNTNNDHPCKRTFAKLNVNRLSIFWARRSDVEEFIHYLKLEHKLRLLLEEENWDDVSSHLNEILIPWRLIAQQKESHVTGIPFFSVFTAGWVMTRTLGLIYQAMFRLKLYQQSVNLLEELCNQRLFYCRRRGLWYDERTKLLDCYIDKLQARRVCKEALSDPYVKTHHRSSILRRLKRLTNKLPGVPLELMNTELSYAIRNTTIYAVKIANESSKQTLRVQLLDEEGETLHVEDYALKYYEKFGWKGKHSETSVFTTIFGILFWDILFDSSIPGVFNSPFQSAPLDYKTEYFYHSRQVMIDAKLKSIENGDACKIIIQVCERERPTQTICVGKFYD
ncbi:Fanconi-associated nuclease 1 [Globomyces sp. JEL0801]|nr:Fanconi-associated nuclease 1 [Globomyces sp. JEL0801]